jgi:ATP-dependent Clp protease adapter protein ClpS
MPVQLPEKETKTRPETAKPCRVILYNDDWHTFDEVIAQLVKATACTVEEAEVHAWNVHTQGREVVFHGGREACDRVANVLRQIRLQTEVDFD